MSKLIRILGIVLIGVLIFLEQVLELNSFVKQGYKIILLVIIPLVVIYFVKKTTFIKEYNIKDVTISHLKTSFIIGGTLFVLTIIGYFILKVIIEPDILVSGLNDRGITLQNIILAGIYLSFVNSFIEEFFFRGFIYQHFLKINKLTGYLVSSALFTVYNVLVLFGIFNIGMGIVAVFGLMGVGLFLVYVNETNKSIINSWIVHIFADIAVVLIGVYLFLL